MASSLLHIATQSTAAAVDQFTGTYCVFVFDYDYDIGSAAHALRDAYLIQRNYTLNLRFRNLLRFLKARSWRSKRIMKFQCISCGRVVSAQLPHLHKDKSLGYCENFSKKNYKDFSDGPLVD